MFLHWQFSLMDPLINPSRRSKKSWNAHIDRWPDARKGIFIFLKKMKFYVQLKTFATTTLQWMKEEINPTCDTFYWANSLTLTSACFVRRNLSHENSVLAQFIKVNKSACVVGPLRAETVFCSLTLFHPSLSEADQGGRFTMEKQNHGIQGEQWENDHPTFFHPRAQKTRRLQRWTYHASFSHHILIPIAIRSKSHLTRNESRLKAFSFLFSHV